MRAYVYSDLSEAEMFHVQPAVSCHVCYVVQLLLDCLRASDCSFACVLVCVCVCVCVCLFVCLLSIIAAALPLSLICCLVTRH